MSTKFRLTQEEEGKLLNFRPFLFCALFLSLGIVFAFYCLFQGLSLAWGLCVLPLAAAFPLFFFSRDLLWKGILTFLLLLACFSMGYFSFQLQTESVKTDFFGEEYFSGRVVEKRVSRYTTGLVLGDLTIDAEAQNCKLIAYMPNSFCNDVELSDELFLYGEIKQYEIDTDRFSFYAKDFGNKIALECSKPTGYVTGHKFHLFLDANTRAKNAIDAGMDDTPAAVTKAVLLGDTSAVDAELYENIRRGGIAHIFAVSGLHVGSLFAFCLLIVSKTRFRKAPAWTHYLFVALILFTYAGICAFSASVVRATVICLVAYLGKLFLVKTDFLQSLGLSALVILLFTPSALFTVGFQLSFAACFGIAFLSKPIGQVCDEMAKLYRKAFPMKLTAAEEEAIKNEDTLPPRISTRMYRAISSFMATSLGAQLFTAPLLLMYFGYISGWALLLNCIFVPFISAVFSLLLFSVFVACLLPLSCAMVVLYVPNVIWSAILLLFEVMDFTSFCIEGLAISAGAALIYILALLFFTDKWNLRKSLRYSLGILCIFAFVATMVALNI